MLDAEAQLRREQLRSEPPVEGLVRGLVSGAVMLVVLLVHSAAVGLGAWLPALAIAASVLGPVALVGGAGVVVLGIAIHLAIAAAWGVPLAYLTARSYGRSAARSIAIGAAYGLVVLLAMSSLVLPWADPTLRARADLIPGTWLVAHLIYGVVLALTGLSRFVPRWSLGTLPRH